MAAIPARNSRRAKGAGMLAPHKYIAVNEEGANKSITLWPRTVPGSFRALLK